MDYEKMLKKAREELPEIKKSSERFEVPKVLGHIQGNKTIISNFNQIANVIHRKPEHILKYLLKELATPGNLKTNALILGRKISAKRINEKMKDYVDIFVICPECKRPDTKVKKEGNITIMQCLACGARHPVKTKI
jgi:translation initiation factor 2 subunit 2